MLMLHFWKSVQFCEIVGQLLAYHMHSPKDVSPGHNIYLLWGSSKFLQYSIPYT